MKKPIHLVLIAAVVLAGFSAFAAGLAAKKAPAGEPGFTAKVTVLDGKAASADKKRGPWKEIKVGDLLGANQYLKTEKGARLEIQFADKSVLRVAEDSLVRMKSLMFAEGKRDMRVKLFVGKVWANVSKAVGSGEENFRVTTGSAVAGVRGTTFRVNAALDQSTVVRVYSGAVAVSNAPVFQKKTASDRQRVQVPGPQQVTKKEWETIIAKSMQQVKVAANGDMSPAEAFAAADEQSDAWVAWNQDLDGKLEKMLLETP